MSSATFFKTFLRNESDQDILKTQYVLASTKIRSSGEFKSIIQAANMLFPAPDVLLYSEVDKFKEAYLEQLETQLPFFASVVLGSLKENFNVVFLCSKNEFKLKYCEYISDFIYTYFKYPMYDYKEYAENKYELMTYDPKKVEEKCKKYLKKAELEYNTNKIKENDTKDIRHKPKLMKRLLKENGIYWKGMTKDDMKEMIEMISY